MKTLRKRKRIFTTITTKRRTFLLLDGGGQTLLARQIFCAEMVLNCHIGKQGYFFILPISVLGAFKYYISGLGEVGDRHGQSWIFQLIQLVFQLSFSKYVIPLIFIFSNFPCQQFFDFSNSQNYLKINMNYQQVYMALSSIRQTF